MAAPINLGTMSIEDAPLNMIIYGLAGCGKTDLASRFPKPMAVIDLDNKYEPMIGKGDITIFPFHLTKNADAKVFIPQIWNKWKELERDDKYKTIVIDSVTALDRMLERYTVMTSGKGKTDDARATLQEYGDMKRWYRTFFPSLASAPNKNIIVLAHEQSKEDGEGKPLSIRPFITGKMGDELSSIFKHTFHMKYISGTNERWELRYRQQGLYVASSSVFSGGTGVVSYKRGEDGYEVLMKALKEMKE